MAITIPKREKTASSKLVIPERDGLNTKKDVVDNKNIREVGLPEHLGGGRYLVSDKPGELIKSPRSQEALPAIGTAERDHIISVALGGTSGRNNLQYLATTKEGRQEGKVSVEQKAINDYVSGKISLPQARLLVATKQQQIKGLTPTEKEQTTIGQLGGVIKDAIKNIFKPFSKEAREESEKYGAYGKDVLTNKAEQLKEITDKDVKPENVIEEIKNLKPEELQLLQAKSQEQVIERTAKAITAPIRFTAGSLATGLVSYGLEKADSEGKYTPKTEAEKLLIGENDIQRLLNQEDLYGTIARGAGVPVALLSMAVIESPFISGTGASKLVKEAIEKEIKQLSAEQLAKLGTKEITKLANGVIRAEQKAGKLTTQQAEQAIKELSNIKVVEQPKTDLVIPEKQTKTIEEPLVVEAKKYKSADEFIKAQGTPVYRGGKELSSGNITNSGISLSASKNVASDFAKQKGGNVSENIISKDAKIINYKDIPNFKFKNINDYSPELDTGNKQIWKDLEIEYQKAIDYAKQNGYDGVKLPLEGETRIINADVIKTKSQLISEWNKANSGGYFYHGTNEDILDNITKEGLKPGRRGQLSLSKTEEYSKSFAKDGMTPKGKTSGIILRVKEGALKGKTMLKRTDGKPRPKSDQINEILTKETIPPSMLEIKQSNKWIPLSEWNKANKTPELKYEPTIAQPSVPNRIKNESIEKGIKADFKGIEEYDKVSFKDQAKLVGDIIDTDPEIAIRIALGKELPKNGALPESVFMAVKNQAIKNGDTDLLIRLATEEGGVAKESTVLGQRIKMLDEQLEDDAFRNINQVVKARRAKLEKSGVSIPKAKSAEINKIKSEIVKAKPKKDEWLAFIDEIEC